ncbi:hypothetical protein GCM10025867_44310 [Frondihabitans sucicola]|uniref:Uncharacterized protein n=1 Tax=Frondihabitans sucicola TaxID=1268041 RepID=A0ABM8GUP7_9MICO|nr:hypothetical protein GCM10025867_44310 [Frondihabitans sucicola]
MTVEGVTRDAGGSGELGDADVVEAAGRRELYDCGRESVATPPRPWIHAHHRRPDRKRPAQKSRTGEVRWGGRADGRPTATARRTSAHGPDPRRGHGHKVSNNCQ